MEFFKWKKKSHGWSGKAPESTKVADSPLKWVEGMFSNYAKAKCHKHIGSVHWSQSNLYAKWFFFPVNRTLKIEMKSTDHKLVRDQKAL